MLAMQQCAPSSSRPLRYPWCHTSLPCAGRIQARRRTGLARRSLLASQQIGISCRARPTNGRSPTCFARLAVSLSAPSSERFLDAFRHTLRRVSPQPQHDHCRYESETGQNGPAGRGRYVGGESNGADCERPQCGQRELRVFALHDPRLPKRTQWRCSTVHIRAHRSAYDDLPICVIRRRRAAIGWCGALRLRLRCSVIYPLRSPLVASHAQRARPAHTVVEELERHHVVDVEVTD